MMFGVFFHAALIFSPGAEWVIQGSRTSPGFALLADILSSFRMSAFFMVSGYFCLFSIQKYGPARFICTRGMRIVVPLLAATLTLNVLQEMILAGYRGREFGFQGFFAGSGWVSHLWFLYALLYYFAAAFFLAAWLPENTKSGLRRIAEFAGRIPVPVLLLILPVYTLSVLAANRVFPVYYEPFGAISFYTIFYYLPFFVFGVALRSKESLLKRFSSPMSAVYLAAVAIPVLFLADASDTSSSAGKSVAVYHQMLIAWAACGLCFYVFKSLFSKPSPLMQYLSEASYTVYLFHHLLVICLGVVMIELNWNALLSYSLIVTTAMVLCLGIHHFLIRRIPLLRFVYNGKTGFAGLSGFSRRSRPAQLLSGNTPVVDG